MISRRHLAGATLAASALGLASAKAQPAFPVGPMRYIVPAPPGGLMDVMARFVADGLSQIWPQPVVVDNRPGGHAMLGVSMVARAAPDGHTVGAISLAHAVYPALFSAPPYDLLADLTAVSILGSLPLVVVVPSSSAAADLPGLVRLLRDRPMNAGSPTTGSPSHLGLEVLRRAAGAGDQLVHVPYRGGPQVINDLMAGTLDLSVGNLLDVVGPIRAGRLRALAVTSDQRHPLLPETPTTIEAGLADLQISNWTAMLAPMGTPSSTLRLIAADAGRALAAPETSRRATEAGFQILAWDPIRSNDFLREQVDRWGTVAREAGIRVE